MSYPVHSSCRKFSLALAFVLFCLLSNAQQDFSAVEKFLTSNQKAFGNDVALIVLKNDKTVFQKELGEFTVKTQAPIASASKWLTAALAMILVEEGKFSLDDKVSQYLPIFESYGKTYITIRQCLSHTTGIADKGFIGKLLERRKYETLDEEVLAFVQREIADNPGKSFSYGNVGLNIVGRIMEVTTKKSFDLLAKQKLFNPLEMKNSSFTPEKGAPNPSGGAVSTAADYMNFLSMILNKGIYKGKRIINETGIAEMQKIHSAGLTKKFVPKVAEGYEYGLGEWIMEKDAEGNSTVVASPGLFGTWPYVDKCRSYACIIFVRKLLTDEKKEIYLDLKKKLDEQFQNNCK